MQLTTVVKLHTSTEEHAALMETLRMGNAACDRISRVAFAGRTFRKYDLHHLTYHNVKAETGLAAGHVVCSAAQKQLLRGKRGQADLLLRDGQFYLSVAVTVPESAPFEPQGVIGVDLGIVHVATDSEGNQYTGEPIKKIRCKYRRLRQVVQPKKTRSARKKLQKRSRREGDFVKDTN